MSFIKSILFGSPGSYNICGTSVEYKEDPLCQPPRVEGAGFVSFLANKCLNSNAFRWLTQGYCHVFIHEMGHAMACKLLTGRDSRITIKTDTCGALTYYPRELSNSAKWKQSVIDLSGPMSDIAFSTIKIVAANALKSYVSQPVALLLAGGAVLWISGELLYALTSTIQKQDNGDFGRIAKRNTTHLIAAATALVAQAAFGAYALIKLVS